MKRISSILAFVASSFLISHQGYAQVASTYMMLGESSQMLRAELLHGIESYSSQLGLRLELEEHAHPF